MGEDKKKRQRQHVRHPHNVLLGPHAKKKLFLELLVIPVNNKTVMSHKVAFRMVDGHHHETGKGQKKKEVIGLKGACSRSMVFY